MTRKKGEVTIDFAYRAKRISNRGDIDEKSLSLILYIVRGHENFASLRSKPLKWLMGLYQNCAEHQGQHLKASVYSDNALLGENLYDTSPPTSKAVSARRKRSVGEASG